MTAEMLKLDHFKTWIWRDVHLPQIKFPLSVVFFLLQIYQIYYKSYWRTFFRGFVLHFFVLVSTVREWLFCRCCYVHFHWSATTLKPLAQYCVGSHCAAKTALMHQGMDSTRPLSVSCSIWQQDISSISFKSCTLYGEPPWIGFVHPAHPIDAQLDWDLGNLKATSTPWTVAGVAGALSCWKRPLLSGNTIDMKGCMWSAAIFSQVVRVKVTSTWMPGSKVSQQNIAQSITLLSPMFLLPTLHPLAISSNTHAPGHPSGLKRDSSDQATFFHCSMVQFCRLLAHYRYFRKWTGIIMGTLTSLWLCSPIRSKLWCTCISEPWALMNLTLVHQLSFLAPLLIGTNNHCIPGMPQKSFHFDNASCLAIIIWPK